MKWENRDVNVIEQAQIPKFSKRAFTYYIMTEGGGGSLKCLRLIMGEGEGSWPYDDISKNNFFHKMK